MHDEIDNELQLMLKNSRKKDVNRISFNKLKKQLREEHKEERQLRYYQSSKSEKNSQKLLEELEKLCN